MRPLELLVAFALLTVFLAHAYYERPLHRDLLVSWRQAELLEQEQRLPLQNLNAGAEESNYPPLFAILLVTLTNLVPYSLENISLLLSYVFTVLLLLGMYVLARKVTEDSNKALLASFVFLLVPWAFYRMAYPISESLGLAFFLLAFHAFLEKRWALSGGLLLALVFVHFRSAAFALATLFFLSVLTRHAVEFFKTGAAAGAAYFLRAPREAFGFQNPFLFPAGLFEVLGFFAVALGVLGGAKHVMVKKNVSPALLALLLAFLATSLLAPLPYRQYVFLAPLLAILAAHVLAAEPRFVPWIFVFGAVILTANVLYRVPPYSLQEEHVISRMEGAEGSVVLTRFEQSYLVPWFAKKKVVGGPYLEELEDGNQRAQSMYGYFEQNNTEALKELVKNYQPSLLLLQKKDHSLENGVGKKIIDSSNYSAYQLQTKPAT